MKSKFLHAIKQTHTHTYIHTNASTSALLITNFQFLFLTAAAAFQIYTACNEQVRMLWQAGRQTNWRTKNKNKWNKLKRQSVGHYYGYCNATDIIATLENPSTFNKR